MNKPEFLLLSIILGAGAVFALIIWYGLRTRKHIQQNMIDWKAETYLRSNPHSNADHFLYAIRYDFSATETGFIVKNAQDTEVARIRYHPIRRNDFITIETTDKTYSCDALLTWWTNITLKDASGEVLCTCSRRILRGIFKTASGDFQVNKTFHAMMTDEYRILQNGVAVGKLHPLDGRILRKGILLSMDNAVPLPIRLFMIADLGRR